MKNTASNLLLALSVVAAVSVQAQTSADEKRAQSIMDAFNAMPSEIVAPLQRDQVNLRDGQGRLDVNKEAKFSYFIQTLFEADGESTLLVPMATSRYTPTYYQTDAWWDAHKAEIDAARREGRLPPKQDEEEVRVWLERMKLSTNPVVVEIGSGGVKRTRLQTFLQSHILSNYSKDGYVTLYRGGEKPGEMESWARGMKPRGARYWTPTANYAWRYARKNQNFLADLVEGRAPLFVFKVPVSAFRSLTSDRYPDLTLGTELTKNAHNAFDRSGVFMDHLYQTDYPGEGRLGVEVELRANRRGSSEMTRYYAGAIGPQELALDRIRVLKLANERLSSQYPNRAASLTAGTQLRIERVLAEARILTAIKEKLPREIVTALTAKLRALPSATAEIAYIDAINFESFVQQRLSTLPSNPYIQLGDLAEFDAKYNLNR